MSNPKKVLLIGLDGMTYQHVMAPLAEQGIMPTCKKLMDEGAWGVLNSTVPPVTGPAWTSFCTGKQPGNHGVFDFFKPTKSPNAVGMSRRLINSQEIDGKPIWQILGEHGMKSIVMNVPVTYPPRELNGVMFTGMLTPSVDGKLTWPPNLYQDLKPGVGEYVITVNWQGYSDATAGGFVDDLIHCQRRRTEYCLRLMDDNPDWNLCFPCYTGTDRIQHALWNYIDPNEREKLKAAGKYDQGVMDKVLEFYRIVDEDIAMLREKAGEDVPVFFVSDHGFGPLYGKFYINTFLEQQGLLVSNKNKIRKAMVGILFTKVYQKFLKTIGMQKRVNDAKARKAESRGDARARTFYDIFYESIDWSKTKAYMASNTEGGLYLNVKGRKMYGAEVDHGCIEPEDYLKVRQEVIDLLKSIKNPVTGKQMVPDEHIRVREDVYHGKYTELAPDIVFFMDDGEWIGDFGLGKGLIKHADWRTGSGTHRMEGCFLAHGAGIAKNPNIETDIFNVVPTILAYMGFPIPTNMDGKFIEDAFTADWKSGHEITYSGDSTEEGKGWGEGQDVFNEDDEEVLLDRLRGLGYVD